MKPSTFLIKSTQNKHFGTAFCIKQDSNGSYFVTCSHVVEDCGAESLELNQQTATLIAIGSKESIDLAVVFVKDFFDCSVLKLSAEMVKDGEQFKVDGFQQLPHKKDTYKQEALNGSVKKRFQIHHNSKNINAYELSIGNDDAIKRGFSGSAVISNGLIVAIATDRNTEGKEAYALPIKYLAEIWKDMPTNLFQSSSNLNPYKGLNSFGYDDQANYYGREEEAKEIAKTLKTTRLLTLLGASGSGKSSLIYAGVVPLISTYQKLISNLLSFP